MSDSEERKEGSSPPSHNEQDFCGILLIHEGGMLGQAGQEEGSRGPEGRGQEPSSWAVTQGHHQEGGAHGGDCEPSRRSTPRFELLDDDSIWGIRGMPKKREISDLRRVLRDMGSPEEREDREFELGLFLKGWGSPHKAAEAYERSLRWRKSFGADAIREAVRTGKSQHPTTFPCAKAIQEAWPHQLVTIDCWCRDGSPFAVTRMGMVDMKRLATAVHEEHFELYMVYTLEARLWRIERLSKGAGKLLQYLDVHDFSMKKSTLSTFGSHFTYFRKMIALQDHYPEQVHGVMLTNMPMVCRGAWGMAKLWTPQGTRAKVDIVDLSTDQNFLTIEVELKNLPYFLGGRLDALLTSQEAYEMRMLFADFQVDYCKDHPPAEPDQWTHVPQDDKMGVKSARDIVRERARLAERVQMAVASDSTVTASLSYEDEPEQAGEGEAGAHSVESSLAPVTHAYSDEEEAQDEPGGSAYESPLKPVAKWHGPPLDVPGGATQSLPRFCTPPGVPERSSNRKRDTATQRSARWHGPPLETSSIVLGQWTRDVNLCRAVVGWDSDVSQLPTETQTEAGSPVGGSPEATFKDETGFWGKSVSGEGKGEAGMLGYC